MRRIGTPASSAAAAISGGTSSPFVTTRQATSCAEEAPQHLDGALARERREVAHLGVAEDLHPLLVQVLGEAGEHEARLLDAGRADPAGEPLPARDEREPEVELRCRRGGPRRGSLPCRAESNLPSTRPATRCGASARSASAMRGQRVEEGLLAPAAQPLRDGGGRDRLAAGRARRGSRRASRPPGRGSRARPGPRRARRRSRPCSRSRCSRASAASSRPRGARTTSRLRQHRDPGPPAQLARERVAEQLRGLLRDAAERGERQERDLHRAAGRAPRRRGRR